MSSVRATCVFLLLAVMACALFAATASCAVMVAAMAGAIDQPPSFLIRSAIKTLGFALILAAGAATYLKLRPWRVRGKPSDSGGTFGTSGILVLVALVVLAGAFLAPRLETYPYPHPDEMHHLVVARNLAVHGNYASGHRDTGLVYFDPYDSVGPPVLLPVAASLRLFGTSLGAGRLPIAISLLVLLVLMIVLFRPIVGTPAALVGGLLFLLAVGTIYLGRSVYGEAPALMFFAAALVLWRRSLRDRSWLFASLAGIALGMATLSKTILLLSVFPFVVAVLHDRLTGRRLGVPHIVMPAVGMLVAQVVWSLCAVSNVPSSTFGLYQHYLMFGLGTFEDAIREIAWRNGLYFVPGMIGSFLVAPRVLSRHDSAGLVALLTAVLYLFWWCFFTDAHIPRYLWFSTAILGFPLAYLMRRMADFVSSRGASPKTGMVLAMLVVLAGYFALLFRYEFDRIYGFRRTMQDELAVLAHLRSVPPGATMATTEWTFERWSHFFLDRAMPVVPSAAEALETYDVVILYSTREETETKSGADVRRIGKYRVYRKEP